jgi:hypothetical protein
LISQQPTVILGVPERLRFYDISDPEKKLRERAGEEKAAAFHPYLKGRVKNQLWGPLVQDMIVRLNSRVLRTEMGVWD